MPHDSQHISQPHATIWSHGINCVTTSKGRATSLYCDDEWRIACLTTVCVTHHKSINCKRKHDNSDWYGEVVNRRVVIIARKYKMSTFYSKLFTALVYPCRHKWRLFKNKSTLTTLINNTTKIIHLTKRCHIETKLAWKS